MITNKPFVIYGCGKRGRYLANLFEGSVSAFIDMKLAGSTYNGIPIISLDDYLGGSEYQHPIVVSPFYSTDEITNLLRENGISFCWKLVEEPSELMGYGTDDFERFLPEPDGDRCIVIGSTFYAWWYYEKQRKTGKNHVYLYTKNNGRRQYMETKLGCHFIDEIDEADKKYCYVASREEFVKDIDTNGMHDIFDMSDIIESYYNPDIAKFKNIHDGQGCFIIGNGPSLQVEDLDTIKRSGCITFGTNRIYKIADRFKPDYYFAADREIFTDDAVCTYDTVKFIHKHRDLKNEKGKLHYFHNVEIHRWCGDIPFSEDVSQKVYSGDTITYIAIQFAAYMGFKTIYLIGVDANFQAGGVQHFYGSDVNDDKDISVSMQLKAYASAKQYADSHGIKIYNATRGGKLDVFERVDFDSLF